MTEFPRLLVVDANILFSFFNKEAARRKLMDRSFARGCRLVSPDFALEELLSDREKIMKFAGIDGSGFVFLLSLLTKKIEVVPKREYVASLHRVGGLSGATSSAGAPQTRGRMRGDWRRPFLAARFL